jgi:hypothetical protein
MAVLIHLVTALPFKPESVSNLLTEGEKQIANTTDLAAPGWGDTYKCKGWCSNNDSPYSWAKKCTWDLHCAACDECKMMQECKPKCQNLAKAGESWTDLCAWPQGKNCHGCPECPNLDTHADMDWPEDSPLECKDCDNGYECGVCLMEIPAKECLATLPIGSGGDNHCTGPQAMGRPITAHMGELCVERQDERGLCGTHGNLDNCPVAEGVTGGHYHGIYRRVECVNADPPPASPPSSPPPSPPAPPPPPTKLKFHTCNVQYADSDDTIYYQADDGDLVVLNNPGDDREKNKYDEYDVAYAASTFTIINPKSDGWCFDQIWFDNQPILLNNQKQTGVWLDNPCAGWDYDRPCTNKIKIDLKTGSVLQKHEQADWAPLDLPYLKVHTCKKSHANTNDPIWYSASPTKHNAVQLDTYGHDDREKNKDDFYYNLEPATTDFNLAATKSDGWCVDYIEYKWASQNIVVVADFSCTREKSVWLDGPCSKTDYDGVPCGQSIGVNTLSGVVTVLDMKGGGEKILGSCSACLTEDACGDAATSMGLAKGGEGYAFAGNYGTKGCYYYTDSNYEGRAYFGTGGDAASMSTTELSGYKMRAGCPA